MEHPSEPPSSHEAPAPPKGPRRGWSPWLYALGAVLFFLALFALGIVPRISQRTKLKAGVETARRPPAVQFVTPKRGDSDAEETLPGTAVSIEETNIYSRVNGYLKRRLVDIGDTVKKDQLLAELDTPELDQQLNQAIATLGQSRAQLLVAAANLNYAQVDYNRFATVFEKGGVSQEEYELRKATLESDKAIVEADKANIAANEANVRQLSAQQEFKHVSAPFDGMITARQIDIGGLVTAGSVSGNVALFHLSDATTLRVFVNVPQVFAPSVRDGQPAIVTVDQFPNQLFAGTVARTSGSINTSTRTLLTEVHIPNSDHKLLPGVFVDVKFSFHRTDPPVVIPAGALVMRAHGAFVALLANGKIHYQQVVVGRDLGSSVELVSGIQVGDRIGMNVGEDILEGQAVTPEPYKPATPPQPDKPIASAEPK